MKTEEIPFKSIKEIREISELTQQQFADKYRIPLVTIKQWESSPTSTSHRTCPEYINHLLLKAVLDDLTEENE